jgi:hypothetical protein
MVWPEILTKIRTIFINYALGLGLAALVVAGWVIELAVKTDMHRPVTSCTTITKADTFPEFNWPSAVKALHPPAYISIVEVAAAPHREKLFRGCYPTHILRTEKIASPYTE